MTKRRTTRFGNARKRMNQYVYEKQELGKQRQQAAIEELRAAYRQLAQNGQADKRRIKWSKRERVFRPGPEL